MSSFIGGLSIEPERQSIGHGDYWAITWAADDRQCSFHTDGRGFGLKESVRVISSDKLPKIVERESVETNESK